jgi:hypothetical protein
MITWTRRYGDLGLGDNDTTSVTIYKDKRITVPIKEFLGDEAEASETNNHRSSLCFRGNFTTLGARNA